MTDHKFLVLPANILFGFQHDIEMCAKLLRASSLMPYVTTQLYDYESLILVIGSDEPSENTLPPTLFIVRNF